MAANDNQQVPSRIGNYQVVRSLGNGCMSQVYLAHDADEVHVALKVCVANASKRYDWAWKFQEDVEHPNLMKYRELPFDSRYKHLTITDYLDVVPASFEPLRSQTFEEIVNIYAQAADALAFLETKELVHGNVKPTNILCRRTKREFYPLLSDAGLRYVYDPEYMKGEVAARVFCYMAPEHLEAFVAEPHTEQPGTVSGDVYSLGVSLVEALSGQTPFRLNVDHPGDAQEVLAAKRDKQYRVIFRNDPTTALDAKKVDDLVNAAIDKQPGNRPKLAEVGARLRDAIDQELLSALSGRD